MRAPAGGGGGVGAPADAPLLQRVVLDPDSAQRLDGGYPAQPGGGVRGVRGGQEAHPIGADDLGVGPLRLGTLGQAVLLDGSVVALDPVGGRQGTEPGRGGCGQRVEGGAQGFARAFQAVERADGGEYVRRVGALLPPRLEPAALFAVAEHGVERFLSGRRVTPLAGDRRAGRC